MNYANPQEHVSETNRDNRVIKEHCRSNYYRLSLKHLAKTLVKYMMVETAKTFNFFPVKYEFSKYHILRMILHQET